MMQIVYRIIVSHCDYMFALLNSYEGIFENARYTETFLGSLK